MFAQLSPSIFVRARASSFARRVLRSGRSHPPKDSKEESDSTPMLRRAFELAYGRLPKEDEFSAAESFLREQEAAYAGKTNASESVWTDLCQMLLASNAFLYVD